MKATEAKLLDFLKKSPQFAVPIYQRTYSWTPKESRQLWNDIVRTGADDRISVHFIGSIVYIERADATVIAWEPLLVIDGHPCGRTAPLPRRARRHGADGHRHALQPQTAGVS